MRAVLLLFLSMGVYCRLLFNSYQVTCYRGLCLVAVNVCLCLYVLSVVSVFLLGAFFFLFFF